MTKGLLVVYNCTVSTNKRNAKLTEKIDWLKSVLRTEISRISFSAIDEINELDDSMISRELSDRVLGRDEIGPARGTDDGYSSRKFAVGGS